MMSKHASLRNGDSGSAHNVSASRQRAADRNKCRVLSKHFLNSHQISEKMKDARKVCDEMITSHLTCEVCGSKNRTQFHLACPKHFACENCFKNESLLISWRKRGDHTRYCAVDGCDCTVPALSEIKRLPGLEAMMEKTLDTVVEWDAALEHDAAADLTTGWQRRKMAIAVRRAKEESDSDSDSEAPAEDECGEEAATGAADMVQMPIQASADEAGDLFGEDDAPAAAEPMTVDEVATERGEEEHEISEAEEIPEVEETGEEEAGEEKAVEEAGEEEAVEEAGEGEAVEEAGEKTVNETTRRKRRSRQEFIDEMGEGAYEQMVTEKRQKKAKADAKKFNASLGATLTERFGEDYEFEDNLATFERIKEKYGDDFQTRFAKLIKFQKTAKFFKRLLINVGYSDDTLAEALTQHLAA